MRTPDTLDTERLHLTAWTDHDHELLAVLASDPEIVRYVRDGKPWSAERIQRRHRQVLGQWNTFGFGWRTIRIRDSGEVVGFLAINHREPGDVFTRTAIELGWWLTPSAWGRGIATEAVRAARDETFHHLCANLLYARYQTGNTASGSVMRKLGLTYRQDQDDAHGYRHHLYTLTRAGWNELP